MASWLDAPIALFGRLVDLDDQSAWQEALVFASTLFGISASVLAAMVLELGPRRRKAATVGRQAEIRPATTVPVSALSSRPSQPATRPGVVQAAVAVAAAFILGRATRSKSRAPH
jgi:hypothetical protein